MGSKLTRPAALKSGSRIGLVAPAGPMLQPDDVDRAMANCTALGFEPVVGRHVKAQHGYLAGTDEQRLEDLNTALTDPSLDAVWCLRGGYGTPRVLAGIDYAGLLEHPRHFLDGQRVALTSFGVVRNVVERFRSLRNRSEVFRIVPKVAGVLLRV